ncbi:MAG: hypothetical protein ACSHYB_03260 [Roseibacillus sp.]
MVFFRKVALVLLFLLIAGVARMPLERPLGREMRQAGILAEPLDMGTSEALGQTSAAIAIGGLRSLVAAVLNFSEVVTAWQDQDWLSIFNTFKQIHTLQPKASYYWKSAAGYAADEAYSDYGDRAGITDAQRKLRRDEFFHKGVSYLDEGIENIPDSLELYQMKARIYSDTYKPDHLDYRIATETLDKAITLDGVTDAVRRQRLYLMARVPERRQEALQLAREIYANPQFRFPSVKSLLYALQIEYPDEKALSTEEIFGSDAEAIRSLFNYYQRRSEGLPSQNIRQTLEERIAPLQLPYALNPLRNADIKRVTLKVAEAMEAFPLTLSEDPFEEATDWPVVVDHFQEYGGTGLPTMRVLFFVLQNISGIDSSEHVPLTKIFPENGTKINGAKIKDLANYWLDEGHNLPRDGVKELLEETCSLAELPEHLDPLKNPSLFPLTKDWMNELIKWHYDSISRQSL